jgi:hypothetical protein
MLERNSKLSATDYWLVDEQSDDRVYIFKPPDAFMWRQNLDNNRKKQIITFLT